MAPSDHRAATVETPKRRRKHADFRPFALPDLSARPFRWVAAGRSHETALYRDCVLQLTRHLGREPSAAEAMLIGRLAWLHVHLARIDERALREGALSPHATREYLAWANSLARLLDRLGMRPPAPAKPSVQELLDAIHNPQRAPA